MPNLNLTLNPVSVARFYDALTCFVKFNESIVFEARRHKLVISTLNSTKSAYCSVSFQGAKYFDVYNFVPDKTRTSVTASEDGKFVCQFQIKALLPVFRSRTSDSKDRETGIEKCEMSIKEKPGDPQCRMVVKLQCKNGMVKTYRLQYEDVQPLHAIFDQSTAINQWKINSKLLKEYMDHFGIKADHLDIFYENGKATFTSFTEKIVNGNEVLKHPLQTSVTLDTGEFDLFEIVEDVHVAINVKDFKAIVTHADTLNVTVHTMYSENGRPVRLSYDRDGLACEFTLMTRRKESDYPSSSMSSRSSAQPRGLVTASRPASTAASSFVGRSMANTCMTPFAAASTRESMPPPPSRPSVRERQPSPPLRQTQSFFLMDDDELFPNPDQGQEGDVEADQEEFDLLQWDETAEPSHFGDSLTTRLNEAKRPAPADEEYEGPVVGPTQQSQRFRGIFDN